MSAQLAKEKIFFTQHLYLMLKGGFLISEALETLKKEIKSKTFKIAIEDVLKGILAGQKLSASMNLHPRVFDDFYCNIIKIGEDSGSLEANLKYLSSQLTAEYETKKKIAGAMMYPAIVITLSLLISFAVVIFIMPQLLNIFSVLNVELPLSTKLLLSLVAFTQKNWLFIILGIIFIIFLLKFLRKILVFRIFFDRIIISFPVSGAMIKNITLARFSQSFYTLLKSGVPILESMELVISTIPNEIFKNNLRKVELEIERGGKLSQGFGAFPKTFPVIFSQMVSVGEKSGSLEDSFKYLAKFYQKEVNSSLKNIATVVEPVLLIFVGLFVTFISLAIITPIYQFSGSFQLR